MDNRDFQGTGVSKKNHFLYGAKSKGLAQIRTGVAGIFDQSKSGVITTTLQTKICQNRRIARREVFTYTPLTLLKGELRLFQYIYEPIR